MVDLLDTFVVKKNKTKKELLYDFTARFAIYLILFDILHVKSKTLPDNWSRIVSLRN